VPNPKTPADRRPTGGAGAGARNRDRIRPEERAPFGRRLAALAIDWAIAMAITYGFFDGEPFVILGIFALQRILVGGFLGSSIGHFLLGLRVVNVSRGRASFPAIVLRTVLTCLVLPPLWHTVAGVPLHDDLARTRLVRAQAV
jgi:uncharacterized RDD family membrane protein YckC